MTSKEQDQEGVLGQPSNGQLKSSTERYASESSLTDIDSSALLNNAEGEAKDIIGAASMYRFEHFGQPTKNVPYQSPYPAQPNSKEPKPVAKEVAMSHQGVDLTAEGNQGSTTISWHDPHPIFVILLVGPEEVPFGIQKDLLCAQSPYYCREFSQALIDRVEYVVKLPDTDVFSFGCFQNFVYTGDVYNKRGGDMAPDYPILMGVWKLATHLRMASLRVAVLDAMAERRQQTGFIPSSQLLVEAWRQTEDDSGLRKMLIEWAAEHMRSNPQKRNAFVGTLPKDILSALVIVLSDMPSGFPAPANSSYEPQHAVRHHHLFHNPDEIEVAVAEPTRKRSRKSAIDLANSAPDEAVEVKLAVKKPARKSEPSRKSESSRRVNRRASAPALVTVDNDLTFTPEKEMEYCRDLIKRMNSGPGYWTRYVPNFKKPVDPIADNAPNYFDVVKKPMCLNMMKTKMDNGEYANGAEFHADIQLIFQNCYEYWTPDDQIWKECEVFENFFNIQWAQRNKYAASKRYATSIKTEVMS
ncbi:Ankyrin bromo and BTB domain-containing [Hyphodiscus hymeniophilus]|uniref:Ankyrin bromo and BTB domain-containing n=1 Tax=Hyphodiscus hymeniophilus TaxID=353542 RepID=A0A9P6VKX3_9HELO|nr:Ankyrin bromo and BTB domain-containing [Hyphodiscus hymeniophilus]